MGEFPTLHHKHSKRFLRHRLGPRRVNGEGVDQAAQVKSVVEPVSECAEVGLGVLAVLQRLANAAVTKINTIVKISVVIFYLFKSL